MKSFFSSSDRIDHRIEDAIGARAKKLLTVHAIEQPAYRFVDLFNAAETYFGARPKAERIETQHRESLNQLLHDSTGRWADRVLRRAIKVAWPIGPREERYLPVDCFWVCPSSVVADCFVVRLSFEEYSQKARLEIACTDTQVGKAALEHIVEQSRAHSIYRNRTLQLAYDAGKTDEYGDIEKPERFQVLFSAIEPVTEEDIVLTDAHLGVLHRNVVDLHTRREILEANGVPARRGVLLHGPPGTGKTFACRYLCHKLTGVTRIFVTGTSLLNVSAIFSFARFLQPSVCSSRTSTSSSPRARSISTRPRSAIFSTRWTDCARTRTSASC